ncbi:protein STRUBBELIG-RECEPTOR FAMILY 2 isoform X2 [Vitis vinifera]|uniref:protein STRUBBELIG-RECEPTOR FAMILY 2 isoform X2 n=1 Tax=Vitis vinifera TaxID=29760 RepID=UPI0008FF9109|nr:protein STRUBBELIG-RECEPTOR FAMILY 2 isoform X2 [Vitis vinifera]|eukprot:XP_019077132.1 PREDICTED: protein STRUBBELIG-RECEPTOR FAMILY 2 isoform X2 [Vitis vinifera]
MLLFLCLRSLTTLLLEMTKQHLRLFLIVIVFSVFITLQASAITDPRDVAALQDLYKELNYPPQLEKWRSYAGDPCDESWKGISCSGSTVIFIQLPGLNLGGHLGGQLHNLHNLKQLDVSSNNIQGEIPYGLPPNATHINLACNKFSQNIPNSLTFMKNLRHLNLSHNSLSGPIGNVFTGLQNLKEMDLSHNHFTGDLPSSFGTLKNLTRLFLQNNKFTGSVIFLADLPLSHLNIQSNHFSGIIPRQFQLIPNLWFGGNRFHPGGNYPPWDFPLETEQNINSPPTTESSAVENYPSRKAHERKKKRLGPGGIALMVGGGTLLVSCAALLLTVRINRARAQTHKSLEGSESALHCIPTTTVEEESPQILALSPPTFMSRPIPTARNVRFEKICSRRSFSKKSRIPANAKLYTVAELQLATNSFSEENLLGEGSLGSVYKGEFPDGQVMAVKNINTVSLSLHEEEQFLDVIWTAARLRHPNIVTLLGYCVEHGQHLLVYKFVRNLSLDDALHCEVYKPLSWSLRLQIALGIARALNYLHSVCSPPIAHCNLKAANILLDEELTPHICDTGLAVLRPLTSNTVKLKASEMAIGNCGYIAPEHGQPGIDNKKSDVYAFGVLLLELLTGRRPFDSSRSREEQSLVKWASARLHDNDSLGQMVDSGIKGTFSSKALSQYADIVSLCIQPEKEFRPPMTEVVESVRRLLQKTRSRLIEGGEVEVEGFDKSFHSTNTRFVGSPSMSIMSA